MHRPEVTGDTFRRCSRARPPRGYSACPEAAPLFRIGRAAALAALLVGAIACAPAPGAPTPPAESANVDGESASRSRESRLSSVTAAELKQTIAEPGARAVIVNVWATWCVPCLEEMPDLLLLNERYRPEGLRLLLVSGDFPEERPAVEAFLKQQKIGFSTYLKSGPDMEFIDGLHPDWSGAMPATLVYDGSGKLVAFHEGKASYEQLENWLLAALGGPTPTAGS